MPISPQIEAASQLTAPVLPWNALILNVFAVIVQRSL